MHRRTVSSWLSGVKFAVAKRKAHRFLHRHSPTLRPALRKGLFAERGPGRLNTSPMGLSHLRWQGVIRQLPEQCVDHAEQPCLIGGRLEGRAQARELRKAERDHTLVAQGPV